MFLKLFLSLFALKTFPRLHFFLLPHTLIKRIPFSQPIYFLLCILHSAMRTSPPSPCPHTYMHNKSQQKQLFSHLYSQVADYGDRSMSL